MDPIVPISRRAGQANVGRAGRRSGGGGSRTGGGGVTARLRRGQHPGPHGLTGGFGPLPLAGTFRINHGAGRGRLRGARRGHRGDGPSRRAGVRQRATAPHGLARSHSRGLPRRRVATRQVPDQIRVLVPGRAPGHSRPHPLPDIGRNGGGLLPQGTRPRWSLVPSPLTRLRGPGGGRQRGRGCREIKRGASGVHWTGRPCWAGVHRTDLPRGHASPRPRANPLAGLAFQHQRLRARGVRSSRGADHE